MHVSHLNFSLSVCLRPILKSLVRKEISKYFLDASSHLYKRVCPSVGRFVTSFLYISEYNQKSLYFTSPSIKGSTTTAHHHHHHHILPFLLHLFDYHQSATRHLLAITSKGMLYMKLIDGINGQILLKYNNLDSTTQGVNQKLSITWMDNGAA